MEHSPLGRAKTTSANYEPHTTPSHSAPYTNGSLKHVCTLTVIIIILTDIFLLYSNSSCQTVYVCIRCKTGCVQLIVITGIFAASLVLHCKMFCTMQVIRYIKNSMCGWCKSASQRCTIIAIIPQRLLPTDTRCQCPVYSASTILILLPGATSTFTN